MVNKHYFNAKKQQYDAKKIILNREMIKLNQNEKNFSFFNGNINNFIYYIV